MQQNRMVTLDLILRWEGSDLNTDKTEPGGASKYGISVDFLTDYRKRHGQQPAAIADVAALDALTARAIYSEMLLDGLRFDELPGGVDMRLADLTTNLGMTGGPTLLQLAIGVSPPLSGAMDDATMTAARGVNDTAALVWALSAAWIAKKHESPSWYPHGPDHPDSLSKSGFGAGWTNRNNDVRAAALALVKAP